MTKTQRLKEALTKGIIESIYVLYYIPSNKFLDGDTSEAHRLFNKRGIFRNRCIFVIKPILETVDILAHRLDDT